MDYNQAIESICFKFGHTLTEFDVFRWLRNFDEREWAMALNVLDKVVYYSSDNIDEMLEYCDDTKERFMEEIEYA